MALKLLRFLRLRAPFQIARVTTREGWHTYGGVQTSRDLLLSLGMTAMV